MREPPARPGREHRLVDPVGEQGDDRVDVAAPREQLVGGVRRVVGVRADDLVARRDERVEAAVGQPAGDEHRATPTHEALSARCS